MKKKLFGAGLVLAALFAGQIAVPAAQVHLTGPVVLAESYYRTELYFGRSKPDGGTVTDEEWKQFLADVVTPRFPDGFTAIQATGQYRERSGRIISEPSHVLVFLYPRKTRGLSRRKIEEIRRAYIKQFSQESVLRLDFPATVNVFFQGALFSAMKINGSRKG